MIREKRNAGPWIAAICLLVLLFIALMTAQPAYAADPVHGTCGENVTWTFEPGTGRLTISGSGPMTDYDTLNDSPFGVMGGVYPRYGVMALVIEEGVTTIGDNSITRMLSCASISLPSTLEVIGRGAFSGFGSDSGEITIPASVREIKAYAFPNEGEDDWAGAPFSMVHFLGTAEDWNNQVTIDPSGNGLLLQSPDVVDFPNDETHPRHYFSKGTTYPPTCAEDGYTVYECDLCGISYTETDLPATGEHHYEKDRCTVCGAFAPANPDATSGFCGENAVWAFDEATGVITIEGTGPMYDYQRGDESPFTAVADRATAIQIKKGITSIGDVSLGDMPNLVNIEIPPTVTRIGWGALANNPTVSQIRLPASITEIAPYAFSEDTGITQVVYDGSETQWSRIAIEPTGNEPLLNADIQCLADAELIARVEATATVLPPTLGMVVEVNDEDPETTPAFTVTNGAKVAFHPEAYGMWQQYDATNEVWRDCTGGAVIDIGEWRYVCKLACTDLNHYQLAEYEETLSVIVNGETWHVYDGETGYSDPASQAFVMVVSPPYYMVPPFSLKDAAVTVDPIPAQAYTGSARKPVPVVHYGAYPLEAGYEFTYTYKNNVNAGTATVIITGQNGFMESISRTFKITQASLQNAKVAAIPASNYTGAAQKPEPVVKVGTKTLKKDTDYTLTYKNNTKAGTATVTITGKGNYAGTKTANFTIKPLPLAAAATKTQISGLNAKTYTGSAVKPAPVVKALVGGKTVTLKAGTDYTVTYKNNTKAGTATVVITGKGSFTGSKTASFKINPANVKNASVSAIKDQTFTGSAIKPALTVKMTLGGKAVTLKAGTDFTVSYKNNTNPGTATATITGKGNFTGTLAKTFKIVQAKADYSRLAGADRYETSRMIADAYKKALGISKFDTICVADGQNYPDALAGACFAAQKKAPILVVHQVAPTGEKSLANINYIKANLKPRGTVYILGGPGSVPDVVVASLR
ncbi:MAG: leucine-rich repeat protein, partial [Firmicutes bacterium]|nr:leucine-rich repeat protein [Bacillota bacterium]